MPADPKLVRDHFLAAAELPAADRAAYLAAHCGDAELRAAVERLLAAHDEPASVLNQPAPAMLTTDYAPVLERPGTMIGPYKLMEQIGEGGFGLVFVAEQQEPVRRKVALKLIKPGMDSKSVIARFEAERQALALMDHPNIARVLDAGATNSGRPYFVMELVRGIPITAYCDQNQLTPNERLELFVSVCHAIQHAHQKGIIHRDVKPSNVLVTSHDGKPVAKVIDFGVAKAIHQHLTERTIYTQFAQMIGTPLYMSPEQAEMSGLDIDTRSDIYSLGVLLYELLTGSTPLEKKRFAKAAYDEIRRLIREEEPPRPSERLSTCDTLPSLAANRKTEPAKLSRMLKGELDWVVMKALEKDRTRRYETANGLARDIQRYLADEVVEARPPSTGYRLKKFASKNRAALMTAAMMFLTLVTGVSFSTYQAVRALIAERRAQDAMVEAVAAQQAEKERAEGERRAKIEAQANEKLAGERLAQVEAERKKADAAKVEAQAKEAEANAVVAFFENQVFAAARPKGQDGGLGKEVSLRDAIVASLPALGQGFAAQPLVEARLRKALGITFSYLGEHEQARGQFERARALWTRHCGPEHPDTLASMNNLANCYKELKRPAEALKLHEEVLEILKRVLPKNHRNTLRSTSNLAGSYYALNRHTDALTLREETLAIQKLVLPKDDPDTLASMYNLARSYAALNRPAEALKLFEETLAIQKRVLPKDHPNTLATMSNLASSYAAINRPADALALREETLAIRKRVMPKNDPGLLVSMAGLADSYKSLNRHTDESKLYEEMLEIRRTAYPPDDQETLATMNNLARSYAFLNRHEDAIKLFEETLAIQNRVLPKDHPNIQLSIVNMADSQIQLNRGAEALPLLDAFLAKTHTSPAVNRLLIPRAFLLRVTHFQKTGDPAGCRVTAAMWEKLSRTDAISLYNAACFRAVTAGFQIKTPGADAAKLAKDDADRAMGWLTKALDAGFKDAAHLKKNTDLDALREREDFKKLLGDLEAANSKKP